MTIEYYNIIIMLDDHWTRTEVCGEMYCMIHVLIIIINICIIMCIHGPVYISVYSYHDRTAQAIRFISACVVRVACVYIYNNVSLQEGGWNTVY